MGGKRARQGFGWLSFQSSSLDFPQQHTTGEKERQRELSQQNLLYTT